MTGVNTQRLTMCGHSGAMADVKLMVNWLNDREIVKFSEQRHKIHTVTSQDKYIESFVHPSLFWCIIERDHIEGFRLIGTITAHVDKHNKVANLGVLIGDKTRWQRGFGTEAWIGMMDYLAGDGIRKIEAGHMASNRAMANICIKSGMRLEGMCKNHFLLNENAKLYDDMELWGKFYNEGREVRS